jgi:hypothetical protein
MALQNDLISIEKELWTGGPEAYLRNLDEDCLVAFEEMAKLSTREEVAGMADGAPRWRDLEIEPVGLVQPTDDMAIVSYRIDATRGDERYRALIGSAYVKRDGRWKLSFHQQTKLPS